MEIFGGLMIIIWMIGFFLTIIWFILPFVIFSIKGRVEETLQRIESIEGRIAAIERSINSGRCD
jgi:hypothetical protein